MFSPRLLKYALAGAISILVLMAAVLGAGRWGAGPDSKAPELIDEHTEIIGLQWCSSCGKELQPLTAEEYKSWRGKNLAQLEAFLADSYPGATILVFAQERVEVEFPEIQCPECKVHQWPQRGYIGLTEDNFIAVFHEDGTLYQIYAEAPGSTLDILAEGIPFTSSEECEEWLINLTS